MKPTVYLILFRGVGGKTQLPTQALREKLTEAGFETVATYINSGNAIVRSRMNCKRVIATIAELCRAQFRFDKAIFARTLAEWDELIARNPFGKATSNASAPVRCKARKSKSSGRSLTCIRRTDLVDENCGEVRPMDWRDKHRAELEHRPQAR